MATPSVKTTWQRSRTPKALKSKEVHDSDKNFLLKSRRTNSGEFFTKLAFLYFSISMGTFDDENSI